MIIIQERWSQNGYLSLNTINDVRSLQMANNISGLKGFKGSHPVIFLYMGTGKSKSNYPLIFPSNNTRGKAYEYIQQRSVESSTIVLDLNEFFTHTMLSDTQACEIMEGMFPINLHLASCIKNIFRSERQAGIGLSDLITRPAFEGFTMPEMVKLQEGTRLEVNRYSKRAMIWSKTLFTPQTILNSGVTPLQFYKYLIDEKSSDFIIV